MRIRSLGLNQLEEREIGMFVQRNWDVADDVGNLAVLEFAWGRKLRVLVVDDHHDCALTYCLMIRAWGHETQCCYSGEEALIRIESFVPDAFVLDIGMPGMCGYELAERLRQHEAFCDTLLIAVSGYADETHRARGLDCGFDHYFGKPDGLREIKALLRTRRPRLHGRRLSAEPVLN
jgi:DNA-binding response OmpR family regulator